MNLFQNKKRRTLLTGASLNSFSSQSEANKKNAPKASFQDSDSKSKAQDVAKKLAAMEKQVAMEKRNDTQSKMSQEELDYPVMYAQQQKAKQDALWVKNNPNASTGELFYPSMRRPQAQVNKGYFLWCNLHFYIFALIRQN